jgi:pimeloyl-ACP methyl ester carboxylesterase
MGEHKRTWLKVIGTAAAALFIFYLAACQSYETAAPVDPVDTIPLESCILTAPGSNIRVRAQCGTLTVYEDRSRSEGRTIDLHVAVLPAVSRNVEPDPLFFIAGGPGQSALDSYPLIHSAFFRINQNRDIVLVDQRGTGRSNPLNCPGNAEIEGIEEDLTSWAETCLREVDADPRFYTTSVAVDDFNQVMTALGYEKINIYGVSYGSRAALTYIRQHPESVRTAILDGVVPQDEPLGMHAAIDAQQALEKIFNRCYSDSNCREAFPEIDQTFTGLLAALETEHVETSLPHPSSGEIQNITFTPEILAAAVRLLSYTPETAALLPLLINTSYIQQDYSLLAAQYLIASDQLTTMISTGLNYSILCTEDVPFIDPQKTQELNAGTYLGNLQTDALFEICQVWPNGDIPPDFKEPVRSELPILLLSGEMDPVTPPYKGDQAAQHLPNSLHLVLSGQGHNVIYRGCVPNLVLNFINSGSASSLNTSCTEAIQPLPFFTSFSGPSP